MKKLLLFFCAFVCSVAAAQTPARFDLPVMATTPGQVPKGSLPNLLAVTNATVTVCGYPATMSGGMCTNTIRTYTDSTLATACPSTAQLTAPGTNVCVPTTGLQGSFGFWYDAGANSHLTYTTKTSWGTFGPYDILQPTSTSAGNPGGSNLQLQFNNNGTSFGGSQITTDAATHSNLTVPGTFQGVQYVLPSMPRCGGCNDIGQEINDAYAALPSSGGAIYIAPNPTGGCYNYSTPIVFATAGKVPWLIGQGTAGGGITSSVVQGSLCLNYVPTDATSAMTLDYVGNFAANTLNSHGLSNIYLINNNCTTAGGCGSSAVGIDNGNTNAGMSGATLLNVSVVGFGTGWRNVSHVVSGESQSVEMLWINPLFYRNTTAIVIRNPTGIEFSKGNFFSNGKVVLGNDADSWAEMKFYGSTFAGNTTTPIIDFTAVTAAPARLFTFGVHFENGGAVADTDYVAGYLIYSSNGDFFEDDSSTPGSCTTDIDAFLSSQILVSNVYAAIAGAVAPCPSFVHTETSNVVGQVSGFVRGFTAVADGPGAVNIQANVFNAIGSPRLPISFTAGANLGFAGILTPLTLEGNCNGGLQEQIGQALTSGVPEIYNSMGCIFSSGGLFQAYNAAEDTYLADSWSPTTTTHPTSALVQDANGLSFSLASTGTCTVNSTFASCFGATPLFKVSPTGVVTANGSVMPTSLTTTGTSGPATLSGSGVLNIPNYTASGGVTSINTVAGAFTFSGAGVSCVSTTCTFTGSGSGIGSITWAMPSWLSASPATISASGTQTFSPATGQTPHQVIGTCGAATSFGPCALVAGDIPALSYLTSFAAPSASWPAWLVPTVTNPTTTPSLAVAASTIPIAAGGTGATTASAALAALLGGPAAGGYSITCVSTSACSPSIPGVAGRTITTTTDTIVSGDRGATELYNSASAVAVTFTSPATLLNNFNTLVQNMNAGVVTQTLGAGTFLTNGGTTLALNEGEWCAENSPDNTNLLPHCSSGQITTDATLTPTRSPTGMQIGIALGHANTWTAMQTFPNNSITGAEMANSTVTATQLAAQYSKGSCTEVWGGTGTSNALTSGDDAISNNTCYNDSGVTRTITAVKCRSDVASNTTTVNPTFGSAGTGTTILSGALTCGSSLAYSSSGTVTNASWTTGTGINPVMGGTLTGTSIAVIVEYTY